MKLAPLGVQPRQARILNVIHLLGQTSQVDLARRFDVTPASMSTMTARLLKAGLISRETNEDEARCNVLRLTDKGRALIDAIYAVWEEVDEVIDEAIGSDDALTLGTVTLKLRNALGGRAPAER